MRASTDVDAPTISGFFNVNPNVGIGHAQGPTGATSAVALTAFADLDMVSEPTLTFSLSGHATFSYALTSGPKPTLNSVFDAFETPVVDVPTVVESLAGYGPVITNAVFGTFFRLLGYMGRFLRVFLRRHLLVHPLIW